MVDDDQVLSEDDLTTLADRIVDVPGVHAVLLGGSRARGRARPDSDVDLGLYYRPPLDIGTLRRLAAELAHPRADARHTAPQLTETGGWGPWVDGGGWLVIDDTPVDWIYRDVDRVLASSRAAQQGSVTFHFQVGHPLGVPEVAYAGEVALGRVLADPSGELSELKAALAAYPPALAGSWHDRLDEARFTLGATRKSARRGDLAFVAGCLFRAVSLCAHAVQAAAGRWVVNEKGLIDEAATAPTAPAGFAVRAHGVLAGLSTDPVVLSAAVEAALELVEDVDAATRTTWPRG